MPRRQLTFVALALGVGIVDGLAFLGFEWVVNHGTVWIWNDLAGSDDVRWRVVPLAIGLSIAFSAVLRLVGEPRRTKPHLDPLAGADGGPPPTVRSLATILLVGAASLLAGASLGPEAPLVALAAGLGAYTAGHARLGERGRVLVVASVGALLVAFLGSLIALLIPLILLRHRLSVSVVAVIVVAAVTAFAVEELLGHGHGFGSIPDASVRPRDYAAALGLGAAGAGIGVLLRWAVRHLARVTDRLSGPWWFVAAVFGAVVGALYLVGGPAVQFSGNEGTQMLVSGELHYGAWALAGIALVKLAVTAWSVAAGYRGGMVFPSVFTGVAVSLCAAQAFPAVAGPGVMLGCVAGLLVAMSNPAIGAVMLLALLPAKLLPLGLAGAAGAVAGKAVFKRDG